MRSLIITLSFLLFPNFSFADCQANVFLRDWQSGFHSKDKAFEWCGRVASSWGLKSDNWKRDFCSVNSYYKNKKKYWNSFFWHLDKKYSYDYGYFDGFDYSSRVHDGYKKKIEIHFSKDCGKYDDY